MHPHEGAAEQQLWGSGEEIISPSGGGVRRIGRSMQLRVSRPTHPLSHQEPEKRATISLSRREGDDGRLARQPAATAASVHLGAPCRYACRCETEVSRAGVEGRGSTANASYQRALFGAQSTTIVCGVEKSKRTIGGRKGMRAGEEIENTDEIPWKGWQDHPR